MQLLGDQVAHPFINTFNEDDYDSDSDADAKLLLNRNSCTFMS